MSADRVRSLVQSPTARLVHAEPAEVAMVRCDECRGRVPWTDLREVGPDRICADCHSDYLHFVQRWGF